MWITLTQALNLFMHNLIILWKTIQTHDKIKDTILLIKERNHVLEDQNSLWIYLKDKFKEDLSKVSFDTWIDSAQVLTVSNQTIMIQVPTTLHKE